MARQRYDRSIQIIYALSDKGLALGKLGKHQEAIDCYDRILANDSNNVYALNNKGFALSKLSKYQEAIEEYDKALI